MADDNATTETDRVWLTRLEACKYLRVSDETLRRLRVRGVIIPSRVSDRRLLYERSDLDAYLASRKRA